MEKSPVILDTDVSNEIDDQFAIAYLLQSLENLNLEAITIAPFSNSGYHKTLSIDEGTDLSYNDCVKILQLMGKNEYKNIVFKGANKYFYESKELSIASEKIIDIARKNEKTTIVSLGAITNVAVAIYNAPDIINKIEVIWLGGNSFLRDKNDEFNFMQDVEAVREVFNSKVKLTVIPCRNVASNLSTTTYEINHYLAKCGEIGKYLCKIFAECKKAFRKSPLDAIGESKTLWDISTIAYLLDESNFICKEISCPEILDDTSYKFTKNKHKVNFVMDLNRHKIFQDFFIKMGYKDEI